MISCRFINKNSRRALAFVAGTLLCVGAQQAFAKTDINIWDQEDPEPAKLLQAWTKQFMAANPDIRVTRTTYQTEDLRQKFITSATAGRAAEILWAPNDLAGTLVTARLLQPADTLTDLSKFYPASLEAVKLNGKVWGVPMSYGNHLVLMYNKEFIKTAPKTTDDMIKAAKQFTNPGEKKYGLVLNNTEPFWLAPIMGGFGAWPLNIDAQGNAKITLNTPGTVQALAFLKDLKFNQKVIPNECDIDCARGLFIEKKAAMLINGDWFVDEGRKVLGDKLGIAPLPIVSATGKPMTPMVSGKFIFVNKKLTPEKTEAVKKFIAFVASKQAQVEMALKIGRIPSLLEAQKDPQVVANPVIKALIDAAAHGKALPPQVEMRAAWDGMRPVQQKVMAGKLAPEAAASEMQKLADEKLKGLSH